MPSSAAWKRYAIACLVLVFLITAGYLLAPPQELDSPHLTPIAPLPQPAGIRLAFNHAHSNIYTDPYRDIQRYGDDLEAFLVTEITRATETVDMAVQELNLPRIARALAGASASGCTSTTDFGEYLYP